LIIKKKRRVEEEGLVPSSLFHLFWFEDKRKECYTLFRLRTKKGALI
jgi:hypothetical protein